MSNGGLSELKKEARHELLKSLVREHKIVNQEMFVSLLEAQGVTVTQATISRDINELRLEKVARPDGSFYYCLEDENNLEIKLTKILKQAVINIDRMEKYVVIKTIPGSAGAVGVFLESTLEKSLFTNLTTDDKVLLIFRTEEKAKYIQGQINKELAK